MRYWRLIAEDGFSAASGLAVDETLTRSVTTGSAPTLRLYTYRPHCALVGRFQNVGNEIHIPYCKVNGIEVNRRPTGGGAILMGPDQLGVALALRGRGEGLHGRPRDLMQRFSQGLVLGLELLGIRTAFRGKNDLEVDGRKIAGLGIYRDPSGGLLFHASLLLDLDVALMSRVLRTPFDRVGDMADRTSTVRKILGTQVTMPELRSSVAAGFEHAFEVDLEPGELAARERSDLDALEREKYLADTWVYQRTEVPDTAGVARRKTPGGLVHVRVSMAGGMIKSAHIGGDFFETEGAIAALEGRLRWHASDPEKLAATVREWRSSRPEGTLAPDSLSSAISSAIGSAIQSEPYGCFVTPGASSG